MVFNKSCFPCYFPSLEPSSITSNCDSFVSLHIPSYVLPTPVIPSALVNSLTQ